MNIPQLTNLSALRTEILVDTSLNSRQTADDAESTKIKKLADSMKVQGILHPPILIRTSQAGKKYADKTQTTPYLLIAGFRRHAAMGEIGQTEGDYRLAPADWTLREALAANMVENLQREDLTTFDVAMQCARIAEDYKMTGAEIAKLIRAYDSDPEGKQALSESHTNNLIRLARKLDPAILNLWREGHPKATVRTLLKIVAHDDQDAQLSEWKALVQPKSASTNGETDGETDGEETEPKRRKPTESAILIMIERVKESDKDTDWKRGAIDALKWACAATDKIPGVKVEVNAEKSGGRKRKGRDVTANA